MMYRREGWLSDMLGRESMIHERKNINLICRGGWHDTEERGGA